MFAIRTLDSILPPFNPLSVVPQADFTKIQVLWVFYLPLFKLAMDLYYSQKKKSAYQVFHNTDIAYFSCTISIIPECILYTLAI